MMFGLGIWLLLLHGEWMIANIRPEKRDAAIKMLK